MCQLHVVIKRQFFYIYIKYKLMSIVSSGRMSGTSSVADDVLFDVIIVIIINRLRRRTDKVR